MGPDCWGSSDVACSGGDVSTCIQSNPRSNNIQKDVSGWFEIFLYQGVASKA